MLSYLQVQDASLQTVGKVLDRMAELRTMNNTADITKNSGDIENYTKEFMELQMQLNQVTKKLSTESVCLAVLILLQLLVNLEKVKLLTWTHLAQR